MNFNISFSDSNNEDANFHFWCFGFGSMACQVIHKQKRSPCSFQENESFQGTGTVRNSIMSENPDFCWFFFLSFRFAPKLFRLPSILTSDNAGTWLVTRKNKNDNNITEEKKTTTSAFKNDNDNSKWLAQPKVEVKVETDVVTLTGRLTKLRLNKWFLVWVIFLTKINSLFFQVLFEIFFLFHWIIFGFFFSFLFSFF